MNLVIDLHAQLFNFWHFTNTIAYLMGRYEPSSPSTKELHDLNFGKLDSVLQTHFLQIARFSTAFSLEENKLEILLKLISVIDSWLEGRVNSLCQKSELDKFEFCTSCLFRAR